VRIGRSLSGNLRKHLSKKTYGEGETVKRNWLFRARGVHEVIELERGGEGKYDKLE